MRRSILLAVTLLFVFAEAAFAVKHKNRDTESPRLIKPANTLAAETVPGETLPAPKAKAKRSAPKPAVTLDPSTETGYWLNTKSTVRHNKKCRYYGKGKNGRPASPTEGKACKVCGG